jgi:creatinine amidohydrolase
MTSPEVDAGALAGKCILLPTATLEDHGPHLPVDTDIVCATAMCRRAAELAPHDIVLMPCVTVGYSPHHIDFPGTLTIRWNTFVEYVLDQLRSLTHHGFRKMLLVNGHGSNRPLMEMAARLIVVERPDVHCAFTSWWDLQDVRTVFSGLRETRTTSHACELETSVYLAVDETRVDMSKAAIDTTYQSSPHFWSDLLGQKPDPSYKNPLWMTEYWSVDTDKGVKGDPSKGTKAKGQAVIEAAGREIVEIVRELRARPIKVRIPHQSVAPAASYIAKT